MGRSLSQETVIKLMEQKERMGGGGWGAGGVEDSAAPLPHPISSVRHIDCMYVMSHHPLAGAPPLLGPSTALSSFMSP